MKSTILFFCLILLMSCKSYELRPEARSVELLPRDSLFASIVENKQNSNSPFSKCRSLGDASSDATDEDLAENDVKNQAAAKGANVAFGYRDFLLYNCESLGTLITAQKEIDEKRINQARIQQEIHDREARVAQEKREKELYSKPHYWLYCGKRPRSQVLPSITSAALRDFKPKAFEKKDSGKCDDEAHIKNMVAANFGIACICTDKEIKLNRKTIEAEFGGAEINQ